MTRTAVIPTWAKPSPRQIADCHWIAHAAGDQPDCATVVAVLDWVTGSEVTEHEAYELMLVRGTGPAANTLAWLLGFSSIPPIQLPRRNPDGTVVTAEQLADEYMTGKTGLPEQWIEARDRAAKDAARYRRLAAIADAH